MNADVKYALHQVDRAATNLARVALLPTEFGAQVCWKNGVIWTRVGEDAWHPDEGYGPDEHAPSSHIGSGDWTEVHA